jgi:hypothetical protein
MAKEWQGKNRLGGRFFFSMSNEKFSGTAGFCSAIARDLHAFLPTLWSVIQVAAAADTVISTRSFKEQFNNLIDEPLRDYLETVVLVVDAVDECMDKNECKAMLQTIVNSVSTVPHLKILLTSRPEPDIAAIISPVAIVCNMEFRLHGIEHQYNVDDITTYVNHHLSSILTDQQQNELVAKSRWIVHLGKHSQEDPRRES